MRVKKAISLSIRLLCICALISLSFAHNRNRLANYNYSIHSAHVLDHTSHGHKSSNSVFASEICSKDHQTNDGLTIGHKQHDDSPCHDGAPCHACRIGSSMLTPPDAGEIGQGGFLQLAVFSLHVIETGGTFFVNSNASPRSPPQGVFA